MRVVQVRLIGEACYQANIALSRVGQVICFLHEGDATIGSRSIVAVDSDDFCLGYIDPEAWLHQAVQDAEARYTANISAIERGPDARLNVVLTVHLECEHTGAQDSR